MRMDFVPYLMRFLGSPYKWGGEGPYNVGFDCSGLVLEGLRAFGFHGNADLTAQGIFDKFATGTNSSSEVRTGVLLFFGKSRTQITHIGVAINNNQFIEAGGGDSHTVAKGMVRIRPLSWRRDLIASVDIFKE